jgi:hypothetical protein
LKNISKVKWVWVCLLVDHVAVDHLVVVVRVERYTADTNKNLSPFGLIKKKIWQVNNSSYFSFLFLFLIR